MERVSVCWKQASSVSTRYEIIQSSLIEDLAFICSFQCSYIWSLMSLTTGIGIAALPRLSPTAYGWNANCRYSIDWNRTGNRPMRGVDSYPRLYI